MILGLDFLGLPLSRPQVGSGRRSAARASAPSRGCGAGGGSARWCGRTRRRAGCARAILSASRCTTPSNLVCDRQPSELWFYDMFLNVQQLQNKYCRNYEIGRAVGFRCTRADRAVRRRLTRLIQSCAYAAPSASTSACAATARPY